MVNQLAHRTSPLATSSVKASSLILETFGDDPLRANATMLAPNWTVVSQTRVFWTGALAWSASWQHYPYPEDSLIGAMVRKQMENHITLNPRSSTTEAARDTEDLNKGSSITTAEAVDTASFRDSIRISAQRMNVPASLFSKAFAPFAHSRLLEQEAITESRPTVLTTNATAATLFNTSEGSSAPISREKKVKEDAYVTIHLPPEHAIAQRWRRPPDVVVAGVASSHARKLLHRLQQQHSREILLALRTVDQESSHDEVEQVVEVSEADQSRSCYAVASEITWRRQRQQLLQLMGSTTEGSTAATPASTIFSRSRKGSKVSGHTAVEEPDVLTGRHPQLKEDLISDRLACSPFVEDYVEVSMKSMSSSLASPSPQPASNISEVSTPSTEVNHQSRRRLDAKARRWASPGRRNVIVDGDVYWHRDILAPFLLRQVSGQVFSTSLFGICFFIVYVCRTIHDRP